MAKWTNDEREFMDLLLVKNALYLWMTLTCQKKRSMELNPPLNFSDNIWIMQDGIIEETYNI
jgi:hypothetical protein